MQIAYRDRDGDGELNRWWVACWFDDLARALKAREPRILSVIDGLPVGAEEFMLMSTHVEGPCDVARFKSRTTRNYVVLKRCDKRGLVLEIPCTGRPFERGTF